MWVRFQAALRLPFSGPGWPRKIAIGAATSLGLEALFAAAGYLVAGEVGVGLAPMALAVNFPLFGYALQVFKGGLAGKPGSLPEWTDWSELTKAGLFLALVGLGYGLIPLLMILVGLDFLVRGGLVLFMALSLIILGLALALSILFFFPMGVAQYLTEERIEAAFRPATLWAAIARALAEYVGLYALTIGANVVAGIASSVPLVGPLLTPFLAFYVIVVQARLFGEVCGQALGLPADGDVSRQASTSA